MKKAFIYLYNSASEKPLNEQRGIIKDYAKKHGIEIIEEFIESERKPGEEFRAVLQNIMEILKERKDIDYILVENFKCIASDWCSFGWVVHMLERIKSKAMAYSVTESNDYLGDPTKYTIHSLSIYYGLQISLK